jgi:hypothetical protein
MENFIMTAINQTPDATLLAAFIRRPETNASGERAPGPVTRAEIMSTYRGPFDEDRAKAIAEAIKATASSTIVPVNDIDKSIRGSNVDVKA